MENVPNEFVDISMEISKENVEDVYWLLFGNYSKM
jgi:hypothetical protein